MSEDMRQPAVTLHTALEDAIRYFRRESLDYRNPNGACARRMDKSVRRSLAASCDERARIIGLHLAALTSSQDGWRPISEAPEGNEDTGPFFDVAWIGKQHRYLPVPARAINCYRERGTIKMQHGYPAVTTIFGPQPTHFRPAPPPPVKEMGL